MSLLRYRGSWLKARDVLDLAAVATLVPEQAKVAPATLDDAPLGRVPDRVRRMGGAFRAEVGRNVRPMAAARHLVAGCVPVALGTLAAALPRRPAPA